MYGTVCYCMLLKQVLVYSGLFQDDAIEGGFGRGESRAARVNLRVRSVTKALYCTYCTVL
jgi:hypothetical protein